MNRFIRKLTGALAASGCIVAGPIAADEHEDSVTISASTPQVVVQSRANDRVAVKLPSLKFEFVVEPYCAAGSGVESVVVSVADSQKRVPASQLAADADRTIEMTVPAKQIAPLRVEEFCLVSENSAETIAREVTIRGVLSAQVSLLCVTEDGTQSISYSSAGLDASLACADAEPDTSP